MKHYSKHANHLFNYPQHLLIHALHILKCSIPWVFSFVDIIDTNRE